MKGTYVLHLCLPVDKQLFFGSRFSAFFKKGEYAYVGSGLNNLEARIRRHMSNVKTLFWHIDYFIQHARIKKIYIYESQNRIECLVAQDLASILEVIPNFGSSDCKCIGHLFYGDTKLVDKLLPPFGFYEYNPYRKS